MVFMNYVICKCNQIDVNTAKNVVDVEPKSVF